MKEYALFIDYKACWGCKACEVACKQENGAPDGIKLISIFEDGPRLVDGKLDFVFRVNVCIHCDDYPCVDSCLDGAIIRRNDGIVVMDYEACTGCALCLPACPYGAIRYDAQQVIAQKCNLCYHRVDRGLIPACADNVCLAHCIYFGHPEEIKQKLEASRQS